LTSYKKYNYPLNNLNPVNNNSSNNNNAKGSLYNSLRISKIPVSGIAPTTLNNVNNT
jgi:hypothetical protein